MSQLKQHPARTVVVIGAGPVGLAAASHLVAGAITPIVIEAGAGPGAAISRWGHVRLFSPWRYNIDAAARKILEAAGWVAPNPDHLPTGAELIEQYLKPLAESAQLAPHIRYGTKAVAVSRTGLDKTRTIGRDERSYLVRTCTTAGQVIDVVADAVIDASGTWGHSNPLGAHGLAASGEADAASVMAGALPDVLGRDRDRFAGRHTLVVGMGHSAANTLLALASLAEEAPGTSISWAIRGDTAERLYGGGDADALPARGKLGTGVKQLVDDGTVSLIRNFVIDEFVSGSDGPVTVVGRSEEQAVKLDVDVIAGATGFRPDLDMLREVRLEMDSTVEAPTALAPLIDPNFHSCGTVPPHGEKDLAHPDAGFYIAGMKSYGRAPTFLMATGYEQVRSIAAALAGDRQAADEVHLELPETGVCSSGPTTIGDDGSITLDKDGSCCGDTGADSCGTSQTTSCGPTEPARGLATGTLHGYSGEATAQPVADSAASCCGSAGLQAIAAPAVRSSCCSPADTAANA